MVYKKGVLKKKKPTGSLRFEQSQHHCTYIVLMILRLVSPTASGNEYIELFVGS